MPLAEHLGLLFQIRDDYINLTQHNLKVSAAQQVCTGETFLYRIPTHRLPSLQYMKGKGFCEDLKEGKFSFPIIFALSVLTGTRRQRHYGGGVP